MFRGQPVSQARIKNIFRTLDASPEDISQVSQVSFNCDEKEMKQFFKDESGQVQEETIGSFIIINKIMEQLR